MLASETRNSLTPAGAERRLCWEFQGVLQGIEDKVLPVLLRKEQTRTCQKKTRASTPVAIHCMS